MPQLFFMLRSQRAAPTSRPWFMLAVFVLFVVVNAGSSRADDRDPDAATPTITTRELAAKLSGSQPVLLFDVRDADEFAVSRIAGAAHVDPREPYADFAGRVGASVANKTVVFYCTAESRSAEFALGVEDALLKHGALAVHVLAGALITWHNERRALVNARGPTQLIHPFTPELQARIKRAEFVSYKPAK